MHDFSWTTLKEGDEVLKDCPLRHSCLNFIVAPALIGIHTNVAVVCF